MKKIALLRGINVGGNRKILMKDLKTLMEKCGFRSVKTYIQSGNVIFENSENISNKKIGQLIKNAILDAFGHDVPTIVIDAKEIEIVKNENPFLLRDVDISSLHVTFLHDTPEQEHVSQLNQFEFGDDKFSIASNCIYLLCQKPYHKSKLSNNLFEKKLNVGATTRNWKTVLKLLELSL